ncbi:hypothetical protein ACHAPJ_008312 [Fusarium lateritium]
MGARVGKAARSVFWLSGQWPWELLAGFKPKKWGIEIMENMRKLFRIIDKKIRQAIREAARGKDPKDPKNPYDDEFEVVRDFLRDLAEERDERSPHLEHDDVEAACHHFRNHRYERNDDLKKTSIIRLTALVESDDEIDPDVDGSDEWEDDDNTAMASQDEAAITTRHRKRRRSSSKSSQKAQKRARSTESDKPVDIQHMSQSATGPPLRSCTFADLIEGLRCLEAKEQEELELVTRSLGETRASIQASEASVAEPIHAEASNKTLDDLRLAIKAYEVEKEDIVIGKEVYEKTHKVMCIGAEIFAKTMQDYAARLRVCDQGIAQANDKIAAEQARINKENSDQEKKLEEDRAIAQRLENRTENSHKKLGHFRVLGSLGKLGPSGMADFLAHLEAQGISLLEQAERFMQAGNASASGGVAKLPTRLAVRRSASF